MIFNTTCFSPEMQSTAKTQDQGKQRRLRQSLQGQTGGKLCGPLPASVKSRRARPAGFQLGATHHMASRDLWRRKSVKGRTGEVPFTCTSKLFESTTAGSPEKEKGEEGLGKSEGRPAAGELLQTPGDTGRLRAGRPCGSSHPTLQGTNEAAGAGQ